MGDLKPLWAETGAPVWARWLIGHWSRQHPELGKNLVVDVLEGARLEVVDFGIKSVGLLKRSKRRPDILWHVRPADHDDAPPLFMKVVTTR